MLFPLKLISSFGHASVEIQFVWMEIIGHGLLYSSWTQHLFDVVPTVVKIILSDVSAMLSAKLLKSIDAVNLSLQLAKL